MEQKTFNYIKLTEIAQTCAGCPTVFEGKTVNGDDFYFRFRWGKMCFEINDEPILYVNYGNDSWAGICDWEEVKQVALQNGLIIDDSEAEWKTEEDYL